MDKTEFTIKRSKWLRGEDGDSFLLRSTDGKMCCLGQIANQCRVAKAHLKDRGTPAQVGTSIAGKIKDFVMEGNNTPLSYDAMKINDDEEITDKVREKRLISLFKKHGITLTFVD